MAEQPDDAHLEGLSERFFQALEARRAGDVDAAAELLRQILSIEPRLAEPRLELAQLLLETTGTDEAEEHTREAIRLVESGGRWTDDLTDEQLLSIGYSTLGEILRRRADSDEVVFGDAELFQSLMTEARAAYQKAIELDPSNEFAQEQRVGFGEE